MKCQRRFSATVSKEDYLQRPARGGWTRLLLISGPHKLCLFIPVVSGFVIIHCEVTGTDTGNCVTHFSLTWKRSAG